ncbi:MAG: DUF4339 domain-containing protein [Pirellulales bacterium]
MLTEWFLKIEGEQRGPVTFDELRSLVVSGQLAVDDLVRSDDDLAWVRAECVAEIHGLFRSQSENAGSLSEENQMTGEMPVDESAWCSLELQSTDTKASIRWSTPGAATVVNAKATHGQHAIVRVPHRTLKVGHGATPAGRAEKQAHKTTVANHFHPEADTVQSATVTSLADKLEPPK